MAKKIIRLTESDLAKLVEMVIKEQSTVVPKLEEFVGKTAKFVTEDKSQMNPFKIVKTNPNSQQNQRAVFEDEVMDAEGKKIKDATMGFYCSTKKWTMYSPGDTQETPGFSPRLGEAIATKWCVPESYQTDY